jgi:hypothetical protein
MGPTMRFLLVTSYAAVGFNAIATIASLVLSDHLGDIELNGAREADSTAQTGAYVDVGSLGLLLQFGARKSFRHVYWQCE